MTQRDSAKGSPGLEEAAPHTADGVEPVAPVSATEASATDAAPGPAAASSPVPELDAPVESNAADQPGEADPEPPSLEEQIEGAQEQCRRTREQLLRTAADFDNFRKRARRETEEARRRGAMATIRDLLPVFDNLERAASVQGTAEAAAIAEGLRLVLRQFLDALRKLGVDRIDAVGVPFDPTAHESIQLIESAEHEAGVVVAVVQPGYRMGSDLIRPAMVVVSKGPAVVADGTADAAPGVEEGSVKEAGQASVEVADAAADEEAGGEDSGPD